MSPSEETLHVSIFAARRKDIPRPSLYPCAGEKKPECLLPMQTPPPRTREGRVEKKLKKYLSSISHEIEKEREDRKNEKRDKKFPLCPLCRKRKEKFIGGANPHCKQCGRIVCHTCFVWIHGVCRRCVPIHLCVLCKKKKTIYRASVPHCKQCDKIVCDDCFTDVSDVCRACDKIDPIPCFCCNAEMIYQEEVYACDCCWNNMCEKCTNDWSRYGKWYGMDDILCDKCSYSESCAQIPNEEDALEFCEFRNPN